MLPESHKVVQSRCFAWPRLPRFIPPSPPRSSSAADLNNAVFQEQRAAGWCKASDRPRGDDQCAPLGSPVRCAAIASSAPSGAEPAAGVSQSRSIAPTTRPRSALATTATGRIGSCGAEYQASQIRRGQSAVPRQPGRALEVEQGVRRASNFSTGRAWIWVVVVSLKGPQRRLS